MVKSSLIAMTALCWTMSFCATAMSQTRPVPLIFDTDIGNDVDDVAEAYHYLIMRDEQKPRTTEALVQLPSQPPSSAAIPSK